MIVAQLSDTHIVRAGSTSFGCDTARYLGDAIAAIHALPAAPDCVLVTGDLVNFGAADEYAHFASVMTALRMPYFVIPGNHDDRDRLRDVLPTPTFGHSNDAAIRYVVDDFDVRIVGLDANSGRPWPGAKLDAASLQWLQTTLAAEPDRRTLVAVHQPPYRSGLHYLDAFGFRGARRLRQIVDAAPGVRRVLCGHVHCVTQAEWRGAVLSTAPSTAPQTVPLLFMDGSVIGVRRERPGFAVHTWDAAGSVTTAVLRRDAAGAYVA